MMEEDLVDKYFFLSHRIPGFATSRKEFWDEDTRITNHMIEIEKELIEKENEEYDNSQGNSKHIKQNMDNVDDKEMELREAMFNEE